MVACKGFFQTPPRQNRKMTFSEVCPVVSCEIGEQSSNFCKTLYETSKEL